MYVMRHSCVAAVELSGPQILPVDLCGGGVLASEVPRISISIDQKECDLLVGERNGTMEKSVLAVPEAVSLQGSQSVVSKTVFWSIAVSEGYVSAVGRW